MNEFVSPTRDDDDRRDARDGNARSHSLAASTDRARFFSRDAARHVYFNKEAFAGLALGLLGGGAWKWNHLQHRQATQEYYRDLAKSKK